MEAAQNQIEADLFETIKSDSEVQSTAPIETPVHAFIAKHVHPPSAVPSYEGIPTNDARTQVVANWVDFNINDDVVFEPTLPGGTNAFIRPPSGFAYLVTTGMNFPVIAFAKGDDGTSPNIWHQDAANTKPLGVYD